MESVTTKEHISSFFKSLQARVDSYKNKIQESHTNKAAHRLSYDDSDKLKERKKCILQSQITARNFKKPKNLYDIYHHHAQISLSHEPAGLFTK